MKKITPFQWVMIVIGIFLMFCNKIIPPILGLSEMGMSIVCIFVGMILMMVTVSLNWPVLLAIFAYFASGIYSFSDAVAMSFGHNIVWLTVFSCLILSVTEKTGLLRRLAIWMISFKVAKKSPWLFLFLLFLSVLALSCVMDCTALILLYTGITANLLAVLNVNKGDKFGMLIQLGVMVFVGVGMSATPIGHSMAVVSMEFFEGIVHVSWLEFCLLGIIGSLIVLAIFMFLLKFVWRMDTDILTGYDPTKLREELGPMSRAEKISGLVYLACIILWLLPSFLPTDSSAYTFLSGMSVTAAPMLCVIALCLIHCDGKPMMNIMEEIGSTQWGAAFTVAAAMMTATAIQNPDAGISAALAESLGGAFANIPPLVFVLTTLFIGFVITQFCPSTIPMIICESIALALIEGGAVAGVNAGAYAVAAVFAIGTAFAAPPTSTFAAITSGQGWVNSKQQLGWGGLCALVCYLIACLVIYPLGCLFIG